MNDRLEQYPEFKGASARFVELQLQLIAKEAAADTLQAEITRAAASESKLDERARAFMRSERAAPVQQSSRDKLGALREDVRVLRRAIELQRAEVERLRARLSLEICDGLAPAHRELVRKTAHACRLLAEAAMAEQAFRDELRDNGILHSSLRAMQPFAIGSLSDSYSRASLYLLECHEFGFIDRGELPEKLRASIPPKPKQQAQPAMPARRTLADGWIGA